MIECWSNDEYLVMFESHEEVIRMTERYGVSEHLPGYAVVGLRGWDDFILSDTDHHLFTIPTVPLESKRLVPFQSSVELAAIKPDMRFAGKVKWYVKPVGFGGDPSSKENLTWVSFEQHTELVRWWNKFFKNTFGKSKT